MISAQTLQFLEDLAANNHREWFTANRPRYDAAKKEVELLVKVLLERVQTFQDLGKTEVKDCIFRINRDVRFSKNKAPYKQNLSMAIGPGGRHSGRIDYYLHIEPKGESFLGGGMWAPEPKQLAKYRQEIDYNAHGLKEIIDAPAFKEYFPEAFGERTKTAPKGYAANHPEIELLKRKQLFFMHRFSDADVQKTDFATQVCQGIETMKPFCDFMNDVFFEEK